MEGHPLDEAIRESAARAEREHLAKQARVATEERERQAATQAENKLAELTSDFLGRMRAAGSPCLRNRCRESSQAQVMGWDLRSARPRFGDGAYRVVTADGAWLHYEPDWDRDRPAGSGRAALKEGNPSVDEATRLLAEALIGYGAVGPAGDGGKSLALCADPGEVAVVISKYGSQIYDEAAGAAWMRISGSPDAPKPTDEILTVPRPGELPGQMAVPHVRPNRCMGRRS